MARWKTLPEGLDPVVVRLIVELRRMKDSSGLSLNRLAKRTGYSASSWERYLGGRAFPPEEAVRALIGITGADETNLTVLYQTAQQSWSMTAADADLAREAEAEPEPEAEAEAESSEPSGPAETAELPDATGSTTSAPLHPTPAPRMLGRRLPPPRAIANSVTSALVGAAIASLILQPWQHDRATPAATPAPPKPTPVVHYTCAFHQTAGQWFAGNSTTDRTQVDYGMAGPEVAEVQCLLQHAGISAGGVDGDFGPKTLHAVIQLQLAHHLDVDGQVGPQTWEALRG